MPERYETAASHPVELEEIESPRAIDTIEKWAQQPAAKMAMYLGAFLFGIGLYKVGTTRPSDVLYVVGLGLIGIGLGGASTLFSRLRTYGYEVHYTRRSKPVPMAENIREQVQVNTSRGSYSETKRRDSVKLDYGRSQEFTFTGRNLDKLLTWLREEGRSIRKIGSAAGHGFNELPDPIHAENYTNATAALLEWEYIEQQGQSYRWTQAGIDWLKSAGL